MNLSRLGLAVKMVATVGKDGFGSYIIKRLAKNNINVDSIKQDPDNATSVIFVNRTQHTPEFVAMRQADFNITANQLSDEVIGRSRLFHTTCFALSKQPAQDVILNRAKAAHQMGAVISIDINYAPQIWPDTKQALQCIEQYCSLQPLVKASEDDISRLFGSTMSHREFFDTMHAWGAKQVCLTLGSKGAILSDGTSINELAAIKIENIMDATGAGDAFWSGFLFGYLKGLTAQKCMKAGLQMAAIKLQHVGRIPDYASAISSIFD
jgi:fructokinase